MNEKELKRDDEDVKDPLVIHRREKERVGERERMRREWDNSDERVRQEVISLKHNEAGGLHATPAAASSCSDGSDVKTKKKKEREREGEEAATASNWLEPTLRQ